MKGFVTVYPLGVGIAAAKTAVLFKFWLSVTCYSILNFELPLKSNSDFAIGVSRAFFSFSFVLMRSCSRSSRASAEESGFLVTTPAPYFKEGMKVMSSLLADSESVGFGLGFIYFTMGLEKRSLFMNTNFYLLSSFLLFTAD